jgi:hypothetical protein
VGDDSRADQVRAQQLGFLEAADDLDGRAAELRGRLAQAGTEADSLRHELRLLTELAGSARTMAKVPFLIPEGDLAEI